MPVSEKVCVVFLLKISCRNCYMFHEQKALINLTDYYIFFCCQDFCQTSCLSNSLNSNKVIRKQLKWQPYPKTHVWNVEDNSELWDVPLILGQRKWGTFGLGFCMTFWCRKHLSEIGRKFDRGFKRYTSTLKLWPWPWDKVSGTWALAQNLVQSFWCSVHTSQSWWKSD